MEIFKNRTLVIATKHHKESVIAPVFESSLRVNCMVDDRLNTDVLGTFTGEVVRVLDPINTARQKCMLAMDLTGHDLSVASEGSFISHPFAPFIHMGEEILLFMDKKNNLEISESLISLETNFNAAYINSVDELQDFASKALFPSHALIIRKSKESSDAIVKGIQDWEMLKRVFYEYKKSNKSVYIETDMRAMYNPTRMVVIENLTHKLVFKISSLCPQCSMPGFGITDALTGLPCDTCNFPTRSVLAYIYSCKYCSFTNQANHPNGIAFENPQYCDRCNP